MALSSQLVWEVRTTGNAANGGAFRGTALAGTPAAPTVTGAATGGTIAAGTYYCVLTYTPGGETRESPISPQASVTLTGTTSSFTVTKPADPGNGATWNLYVGTASGGPYFPQGTALAVGSNRVVTATPPTTGTQPPGVDYSQQDSPQITYSDLVIGATNTTATSAASPFTPAHVGNLLNQVSGTGFTTGRYEITGVTAAGVATFDRALGTANSTGGAGRLGGAADHPATIGAVVAGHPVFVKYSATPFTTNSTTSNVSGGAVFNTAGGASWVGYDTNRNLANTDANRPTLRAGVNALTFFTGGAGDRFANLTFDNPSAFTSTSGIVAGGNSLIQNCKFTALAERALNLNNQAGAIDCEFASCGASHSVVYMQSGSYARRCVARSCTAVNTTVGVFAMVGVAANCTECVATGTTGGAIAFNMAAAISWCLRCVAHGGTGGVGAHGFLGTNYLVDQCIAYGNAGYGFTLATGTSRAIRALRCFAGANTVGNTNPAGFASDILAGVTTLSGDPFTNAAGLDFSLNNVAGAGALCRGLTVPLPGGTTTSYPDAGAAQSAAGGGGGATYFAY